MTIGGPGDGATGPLTSEGTRAPGRLPPAPTVYWLPLLVWGALIGGAWPLSVIGERRATSGVNLYLVSHPSVTGTLYLGGDGPPGQVPLAWYWVGALLAGPLVIAAWVRWRERAAGRTPLRRYLMIAVLLATLTAAVPLLGWGMSIDSVSEQYCTWLLDLWQLGTAAQLAVAVGLAVLAWHWHSRSLAITTAIYTLAACLAGWLGLQPEIFMYPGEDPVVVLPAAVLLLAGLGNLLLTGLRSLQSAR